MKTLLPLLTFSIISLSACQKAVEDTNLGTVSGSFRAKINGVSWSADQGASASFSPAANGLPALLSIAGRGKDKKLMGITVADSGAHRYTLSDGSATAPLFNVGIYQDSGLASAVAFASNYALGAGVSGGTLTVTSVNRTKKTVSGTFSFTAYRAIDTLRRSITEGVFTDIPYADKPGLPATSSKDTFTVKIDGTTFTPFSTTGLTTSVTNVISVQGSNQALTKTVGLLFPNDIKPGSYTLDVFGGMYIGLYINGTTTLSASGGTLQVLEHNLQTKRVRGNFNFKGEAIVGGATPAQLTEGYFSVKYQ